MNRSKVFLNLMLVGLMSFLSMGCSLFGVSGVEESRYKVLFEEENMEIRRYEPRILATTTVNGEYKEAQTKAFRILADYIFGNNKAQEEVEMTAPVQQSESERSEKVAMTSPVMVTQESSSEKVAMTAPVTQQGLEKGWKMTFMMPSKYKEIEDLPVPNSKKIEFVRVPEKLVASIRFSWLTDEDKNQRYAKKLKAWLQKKGDYKPISEATYAGYNPPWTLPMFRRQEVHFDVVSIKLSQEDPAE